MVLMAAEIPTEQVDKLCQIIEDFAGSRLPKESAILKGKFTRTVNQWAKKYGVITARETVWNAVSLFALIDPANEQLQILLKRVTVNSLYKDHDSTWGWYCPDSQAQAEKVPLVIHSEDITVSFFAFNKERELWESRGFQEAVSFPYIRHDIPGLRQFIVHIRRKDSEFWNSQGYYLPEEFPYERDGESLTVTRNLKEFGFWKAWKWWEGCQAWYKDKHPEWFFFEGYAWAKGDNNPS
jgi:hypothetical protein